VNINFSFVDAFLRHPKLNLEAPENRRGTYKIINEEIDLFQNKTISNLYWVNYLFNDSKFQFMAKDRLSNSAIESVASFGDLNLLKKAISKYSGDINDIVGAFGKNLLENAVYETDIELAKFLIQLGMDVNRKDNSGNNILHRLIHTSSDAGDTLQMINYLLTLGLDINNNAFIIDLINFDSDSSAVVLNLIQRPNTDINIVNNLGQSILVKMISYNYPLDVIETLLKLPKFNINYRDNKSGFTALGFITEYQRDYKQPQEIIALLKKYGAQL
jgi:ankyrin repeat protein